MARFSRRARWLGIASAVVSLAVWFTLPPWGALFVIGGVVAALCLMITIARLRRLRGELSELRQLSDTVQNAVMRPLQPRCGSVRVEARYAAAAAGARVGGDLYDVVDTPYGVRAIIGDVVGHGLSAVGLAADVLGAFRELAQHEPRIAGIAQRLDTFLLTRIGELSERFVTAILVQIPDDAATAELFGCGHPPPLILRGGRLQAVSGFTSTLPLGLISLDDGWCAPISIPFDEGDALLLYTDGITEARNGMGRPYPFEQRAGQLLDDDPALFLGRLESDMLAHTDGRQHDDVALLLLRSERAPIPSPTAPVSRGANRA